MKIKITKVPKVDFDILTPWYCALVEESWEDSIVVGYYKTQSEALNAGILAYKFANTQISFNER